MSDAQRPAPTPSPSQPIIIRENIDSLSQSLSDQIEMLVGELRSRWKSGKHVGIETLGAAFDQIAKNEEQLLDLVYHEVLIREEFGEKPKLEDFASRFPQHVERLQRLFAVHGAIEDDGWDEELDSAFADNAQTMTGKDSAEHDNPSSTELGDSGVRKKAHWPRKLKDARPVEPPPGYELLEELGRGGMAVVFRAKQQILNRIVALKMLLAGGVASKEVLARVQQEAQAVAQLQHPGIVQIHEVGEHRGLPYLSLEYVAGGTLHSWLDGRPLPPLESARIIEQLARTTQYAHEHGVVHRDLKPANVLLSGEWGVRSGEKEEVLNRGGLNDDSELSRPQDLAVGNGSGRRLLRTDKVVSPIGALRTDESNSPSGNFDPGQHRGGTGATTYEGVPALPQHRAGFVEGTGNTSDPERAGGTAAERGPSGTTPSNRGDQPNADRSAKSTRKEVMSGKLRVQSGELRVRSGELGVGSERQTFSGSPLITPNSQLPTPFPLPTLHSSPLTLKISDFGLARVLGSRSDLTATGQVIGTPSYMAPEQAAGTSDDVSPSQDIYSLGAILYELLTGRPPFRGSSLFDTLEQVRSTEAVPPRQLQPRVPRDLETICLKCLEKSPERRYSTALALAEDLRRVQDGDTITARPAGTIERSWKLVRRYPAIASLASLTVLLTIAGIVGIMRENRRATDAARRANNSEVLARQDKNQADRQRDIADEQRRLAEAAALKAEQQSEIARKERTNAEQQQQLAESERARAVQAQKQAEESLEEAFKTLNTFAMFGWDLRYKPGMQAVSQQLLDNTLRHYENLAKKQGDTSASRRQRIMALIAAGDVYRAMRQNERAEQLLIQSVQLLDTELQSNPSEYDLHFKATGIFWALGVLYKDTNRPQESLAAFHRDLVAHDALLQQKPDDIERRVSKANIFINMCVAYKDLGKPLDALVNYEAAIATLREILKTSPNHAAALGELALALHDHSMLLYSLGRKAESQIAHLEAFDIRKKNFQRLPNIPNNRTFLARSYSSQGWYDLVDGKLDSSIANYQSAVDLLRPLVEKSPDVYEYHLNLINTMIPQLTSCMVGNNVMLGRPLFEQVSMRLTIAAQKFPKDKSVLELSATWQHSWADFLWEEGHTSEAQVAAKQSIAASLGVIAAMPKMTAAEEAALYNKAAWRLAMTADPKLRDPKKAIELGRKAVELAPDNPNYWHTLGTALYSSGNYPAAREALLKSIHFEQLAAKRSTLEGLIQTIKALPNADVSSVRKEFDASLGLGKSSPSELAQHYSLLAMTLWKLDDKDAARKALSLIVDPSSSFTTSGPETRRLIAEARKLVTAEVESPKADDAPASKP